MVEQIPMDDRGLLLGDGLFETLLATQGRLIAFAAHAERLIAGCAVLGLPAPSAEALRQAAQAAMAAADLADERAAVRLSWTAGSGGRGLDRPDRPEPRLLASAARAPEPDAPARMITASVRRNQHSPASRLKTLAYLDNVLARREARLSGADEALMLNGDGHLACAAAANLFWIREGRLFTPALACGVLAGVVRGQVLAAAAALGVEAAQVALERDALATAEAVFLTNSLIGLRSVAALDGAALNGHPLIEALSLRIEALAAAAD